MLDDFLTDEKDTWGNRCGSTRGWWEYYGQNMWERTKKNYHEKDTYIFIESERVYILLIHNEEREKLIQGILKVRGAGENSEKPTW